MGKAEIPYEYTYVYRIAEDDTPPGTNFRAQFSPKKSEAAHNQNAGLWKYLESRCISEILHSFGRIICRSYLMICYCTALSSIIRTSHPLTFNTNGSYVYVQEW